MRKMQTWEPSTIGDNMNSWPESAPLLAFDLETTGTNPYGDHIVDMALVLDDPLGMGTDSAVYEWQWLVNPGVDIPLEATAIHGISTDNVQHNGAPVGSAVEELQSALESLTGVYGGIPPVCIYNAPFDVPIILRASGGLIGADWTILDPLVIDKAVDTYRPGKRTLTAVSAAYGLGVKNAHRAAGDCLSTIRLTREIGRRYPKIGMTHPNVLHKMQVPAYQAQMQQFVEYKRGHGEPEFSCNTNWPYDANLIFGDQSAPPYSLDEYARRL
jgi:DNA polymerase-3 subunit epsilon